MRVFANHAARRLWGVLLYRLGRYIMKYTVLKLSGIYAVIGYMSMGAVCRVRSFSPPGNYSIGIIIAVVGSRRKTRVPHRYNSTAEYYIKLLLLLLLYIIHVPHLKSHFNGLEVLLLLFYDRDGDDR